MGSYQRPGKKKVSRGTGGTRMGKHADKKLAHAGSDFTPIRIADKEERSMERIRGGKEKSRIKKATYVNVVEGKSVKKAKIIAVLESHDPEFVRRGIITKGAVLNTEIGKVRVTNRPGQDGMVNGIIVKSK